MTRQSIANLCFSVFFVLLLAYAVLVQWSGDVQHGAFRNPELVRWANRIVGIPTIGFGLYASILGVLTLRQRKYPPAGIIVPFATAREVNWNPVATGGGLVFAGTCGALAPIVIAALVGL